ncbi:MAG: class I SAM-dependent methyltransferase [Pirellulales bacterium]
MPRLQHERLFFREFRRNFRTTGAILPSGRALGFELARYVRHPPHNGAPRRILEAGPGTGAVTRQLISALAPDDALVLVEFNSAFVDVLNGRLASDPHFRPGAGRVRVLHGKVEDVAEAGTYDLIVSGLPLNNFHRHDVARILETFGRLIRPGGVVSFFEYAAVRRAKTLLSRDHERRRLHGVDRVLSRWLGEHRVRSELVLANLPPAWVHHARPVRSTG